MPRVAAIAWLGAGSVAASIAACQAIFPTDHFVSTGAADASSDVASDVSSEASSDGAVDAFPPDASPDQVTCTPSPTDPANCGRCGHDCRGGACVDGGCQPFAMASVSYQASPGFVAVDSTNVYWAVYYPGGVYTCPKTGCPDSGATQLVYDDTAIGVAVDGQNVYWAQNGNGSTTGAILACPLDAGSCDGGTAKLIVASGGAQGVAVDQNHNLDWTTNPFMTVQLPGSAYTCVTGGCPSAPQPFTTDDAGLEGIAFAGNGLPYWVDRNGVVMTCATSACLATNMVASGGAPGDIAGLAADDASVYWGSWGGANPGLYTCPLGGCPTPTVLLSGLPVYGIAVDDQAFYWTQQIGNSGAVTLYSMVR